MPSILTSIEIAAPPTHVREIFLDLPSHPEWTNILTSVAHKTAPSTPGTDLTEGDIIAVTFAATSFDGTVLTNNPSELKWMGGIPYLLTGKHYFRFEESEETPGGTRFVQGEDFTGPLSILLNLPFGLGPQAVTSFKTLNEDLKKRCESLK